MQPMQHEAAVEPLEDETSDTFRMYSYKVPCFALGPQAPDAPLFPYAYHMTYA
jgi:hypothetical protein